jgi:hypothetical protein
LQKYIGNFHIHENLVCINEEGIVKVWCHENLSYDGVEPVKDRNSRRKQKNGKKIYQPSQNSMVWQVVRMVDRITVVESVPERCTFGEFVKRSKNIRLNFGKAIELLHAYTTKTRTSIPEILHSITKTIRRKKGIADSEADIEYKNEGDRKIDGIQFNPWK